ncbi:hypothetical protein B0T22DRAFT_473999 [Podospora appendiculata]|uniref:Uncharacterized protein n=1 Tax=Podospora appendiculata TaxID=314037 RepID=A0AAE1C785_9PEZI|nr:hypothetical protein B0T22DRAFT_473999 [Podospora appendiculata]
MAPTQFGSLRCLSRRQRWGGRMLSGVLGRDHRPRTPPCSPAQDPAPIPGTSGTSGCVLPSPQRNGQNMTGRRLQLDGLPAPAPRSLLRILHVRAECDGLQTPRFFVSSFFPADVTASWSPFCWRGSVPSILVELCDVGGYDGYPMSLRAPHRTKYRTFVTFQIVFFFIYLLFFSSFLVQIFFLRLDFFFFVFDGIPTKGARQSIISGTF